nr:amylo-alpha-1,6-glucosidase [Halomicronema hongdechloris]
MQSLIFWCDRRYQTLLNQTQKGFQRFWNEKLGYCYDVLDGRKPRPCVVTAQLASGGDPVQRDGSYHQGTVWGWLMEPFVQAHRQVYWDPAAARRFLMPLIAHLQGGLCWHPQRNL